MYAVITLRITIFILHLCAESLKNSVLISSKDLSSQIPIVNPRPYWKRWGGGGEAYLTVNAVLVARKLQGD